MNIGYVPSSHDFTHPSDRRKFFRYLNIRDLPYEVASFDKNYDVLYVSIKTDLTLWSKYRKANNNSTTKIIFDLSDAYLEDGFVVNVLRSIYHYLSGRSKYFSSSYAVTIMDMISCSSVLLCGSLEQKQKLDALHQNVIAVQDYFDMDIFNFKTTYDFVEKKHVHVLWEGYSHGNKEIFALFRDILSVVDVPNIHIHVIADNRYCEIGGKFICGCTHGVLERLFKDTSITLHTYDWSRVTFSAIASSCDFAIIPIPNRPRMMSKPENKLLLLWSIGLPVLTSDTPSYMRVMNDVGYDMTCSDSCQWKSKIQDLIYNKSLRIDYMNAVLKYMQNIYSKDTVSKTWDSIIELE